MTAFDRTRLTDPPETVKNDMDRSENGRNGPFPAGIKGGRAVKPNVICIGELLWDHIGAERHLGGAPLNTGAHLAAFGFTPWMISRVGEDEAGAQALSRLDALGIRRDFVKTDSHPTASARVFSRPDGTPDYELSENSAYDYIDLSDAELDAAAALSPIAVVYGSLTQKRSELTRSSIRRLMKRLDTVPGLFDVNLRKDYFDGDILRESTAMCGILKLNENELPIMSSLMYGEGLTQDRFVGRVFAENRCEIVVITHGERGAEAYDRCCAHFSQPGIPVDVADTVGAGDAFNAGFLCGLFKTKRLSSAVELGNRAGAYVASRHGGTPPLPEHVTNWFWDF